METVGATGAKSSARNRIGEPIVAHPREKLARWVIGLSSHV
jgi:hypothetical protein